MNTSKNCPCKRIKCPRHGKCELCRAHHAKSKYPLPCEKQQTNKQDFKKPDNT